MVQIPRQIFFKLKQEVQFFHRFTDEELLVFLRLMTTETYQQGEVIFQEFDPGKVMYLLVRGTVEIRKRIGKHNDTVLAVLKAGECFGEIGLIDNRPRSASAICLQDTLVFSLSLKKLMQLAHHPKFAILGFKLFHNFAVLLASRLRDTNQKVVDLTARFATDTSFRQQETDDPEEETKNNEAPGEEAAE